MIRDEPEADAIAMQVFVETLRNHADPVRRRAADIIEGLEREKSELREALIAAKFWLESDTNSVTLEECISGKNYAPEFIAACRLIVGALKPDPATSAVRGVADKG